MVGMSQMEIVSLFGLRNATVSRDEVLCSCPFPENHRNGDSHPSFRINTDKGLWICYGCGERGNIVQLAQRVLGMSPIEAHSVFDAELTDSAIDELVSRQASSYKPISPLDSDISKWSRNSHPYWKKRGFTDETIGKWRLGYDPQENRVVVPVMFGGKLVGWSMRAVDDETKPKWKHCPGMPKSEILFGMDNFTGDCAVLVEAPLSVIMLDQHGVSNAVASFGCNLSDSQARLIRSSYNHVLVFYDPDDAGQNGAAGAVEKLEDFVDVYVVPPTRDDAAAMTMEENIEALRSAVPSWALGMR